MLTTTAVTGLALLWALAPTKGDDPRSPDAPTRARLEARAEPSELDFDLLPPAPTPPAKDGPSAAVVGLRRGMLTFHQGMGLATMATLAAAVVVGHLSFVDRFYLGDTGALERPHRVLAYTSEGLFAATGALALFAPVPYARPKSSGLNSAAVHRVSMLLATACMAAQVGLGLFAASREGYVDQLTIARAHLVTGYAALGFMTIGAGALVLAR